MDKQNYNLDDIKDSSFIDKAGKYTLTIKGYKADVSQNGKEFHKYECESEDGGKINITLYLIDNAMWKYKAFMKACGLPGTGVVNLDLIPQSLVGKKFIGDVQKQPAKINVLTGMHEESKYFEVAKFYPVQG